VSGRVLPAALALSGVRVALGAVAVALALPAVGEAPVTREAVGTLAACRPGDTLALARCLVAERVHGAPRVTLAHWCVCVCVCVCVGTVCVCVCVGMVCVLRLVFMCVRRMEKTNKQSLDIK